MRLQETEMMIDEMLFFQENGDIFETAHERHRKTIKFKQERLFPAHKKSRAYRRKVRTH